MFFRKLFDSAISFFLKIFKKKRLAKPKSPLYFSFFSAYGRGIQKNLNKFALFIKRYRKLLLTVSAAVLISDLLLIKSYVFVIPDQELPALKPGLKGAFQSRPLDLYKALWENNIFHTGPIPLQLKELEEVSMEPVLSSLPFKLTGTIVHANPMRSVASIKAGGETASYKKGEPIENQAEIREIQRGKVIFFNQNNNRMEYIALPKKESPLLNISYTKKKPEPTLVERTGEDGPFRVKRSIVEEHLQNLPEILNQARVVPHRSEEGDIEGWKFAFINKGSVFEELGFQKGDILKKVDGQKVQTMDQALELFHKLRWESRVKLVVEQNGVEKDVEYIVKENAPFRK